MKCFSVSLYINIRDFFWHSATHLASSIELIGSVSLIGWNLVNITYLFIIVVLVVLPCGFLILFSLPAMIATVVRHHSIEWVGYIMYF